MINVFFPYYQCGDDARQKEIDLCLRKNIENPCIDRLMVMIDDGSTLPHDSPKVTRIELDSRPTYQQWVSLTMSYGLQGVSVLCNSDIYFDDSVVKLQPLLKGGARFLALSRWELQDGDTLLHSNPHWSQDVWGIPCTNNFPKALLRQLDFPLGVPRCDNKIAYLFGVYGWSVFNPCREVRSIHVHETQMRTYDKKLDARILGGVAYVHPSENVHSPSKLDVDVWVASSESIGAPKMNKSMEKWRKEQEASSVSTSKTSANIESEVKLAEPADALDAIKYGDVVREVHQKFTFHQRSGSLYLKNRLEPLRIVDLGGASESGSLDSMMVYFIPPVLDTWAKSIGDKPRDKKDLNFWQYPCATEKQAYANHKRLKSFEHINAGAKIVNLYVPLPWATFIDKKMFHESLSRVARAVDEYKDLAEKSGYQLKVHSVCQHIHWIKIVEKAYEVGVTDLHLSHKTTRSVRQLSEKYEELELHGWPLIAVNYEVHERSIGLRRKSMEDRIVLASFVGAYMPHYLDESRLKLQEAAANSNRDDIVVDLGDEWHFNKHVYEEQVLNREIDTGFLSDHEKKTSNYNKLISSSKFSLCPVGAGPNTLRFWESIAVGAVPVIFQSDLSFFKTKVGEKLLDSCIVYENDIDETLFDYLSSFSNADLQEKHERLVKLYEELRVIVCF